MKIVRRSFGWGTLRLEVTERTLRYEKSTIGHKHTFEAPLSEISPTIERFHGTAIASYACAAACLLMLISHVSDELQFAPIQLAVAFVIIASCLYFLFQARRKSGSYSIVRSTRESSRDIWILRNGAQSEVDAFIAHLLDRVASLQKPNKAPEPTSTSVTSPAAQEPRQP